MGPDWQVHQNEIPKLCCLVEMVSSTSYKKVKTGGTDGEECPTGTMYDGG